MQVYFLIRDINFGGGGERVTVNLANWLNKRGYDVTIVSIALPGKENIFTINKEISIEYLGLDYWKGFNVINKLRSVFIVRRYFTNLADPKTQSDLVMGIGTYPNLLLALLPNSIKIKKIGCLHCSYNSLNYQWEWLGEIFFPKLDVLVSLTERDVERWQTMNNNAIVIPNAVSFYPEEAAPLKNKRILAVGRIDYPKGYDLLLDVFERFAEEDKEWSLRIIGEGPLKERIAKRIKRSGLTERIEILPPTGNIMEEYGNASVLVMTSRTEGFPMVLLEAQACGVPTLAFDCETGPAEIIHHEEDGFLIEPNNTKRMAEKLLEICRDVEKRRQFGRNGRENSKGYLPDVIGEKWERIFNELVITN